MGWTLVLSGKVYQFTSLASTQMRGAFPSRSRIVKWVHVTRSRNFQTLSAIFMVAPCINNIRYFIVQLMHSIMSLVSPKKLVRLIKMCLTETYSRVRVGKNLSEMFPIRNGLKQGDALSPLLCFSTLLWNMPLRKKTKK